MSEVSFQENVICHLGTEKLASEKKNIAGFILLTFIYMEIAK